MAKPAPHICNNIEALLAIGENPKEISERLGVDYSAVSDIRRNVRNAKKDADVKWAAQAPEVLISEMVDRAKREAPSAVVRKMDKIHEGLKGIQLLDSEFHTTMTKALKKANQFLDQEDLKVMEWVAITNSLSIAYNNIFNSKASQINVNNGNVISSDKLAMFKGALRG